MNQLFFFPDAVARSAAVDHWLDTHAGVLGDTAARWVGFVRGLGDDVTELMHDGCATACVREAAFAYVGIYKAHVNVGFYRGAELADPAALLQGTGRFMRHVKLEPGKGVDAAALEELLSAACRDIRDRAVA